MVVFYAIFCKNLSQFQGCYAAKRSCFPELLANWCLTLKRNTVYLAGLQAHPIVRHFGKVLEVLRTGMITKNQIWKLYGTDFTGMTKKLLEETDLAALIGNKKTRIGIKPNLVVASPAEFGGTTHPEVVAGIVEYLQEHGFQNITIVEGSWVGDRTSDAYKYCGYKALCEKYGVPFVDGQKEKFHTVDCAGMKLNIINAVDRIDFLINVPVIKGH